MIGGFASPISLHFFCLIFVTIPFSAWTQTEKELVLTKDNFVTEVSKGSHFVMFYAPWCGHCKRLHPVWGELATKYNEEQEGDFVTIGKVDCTVDTALCSDHGVTGYPTLKLFNGGATTDGLKYRGPRDVASFDTFLADNVKSGDEAEAAAEAAAPEPEAAGEAPAADIEDGLAKLTASTFDAHVLKGIHFVKFFAPWCGHCQRMAPAWDQLAKAFEDDDQVSIGRVDCTLDRSVCDAQGVRGYPTLLLFTGGEKQDKYQGGREFQELFAFVTKMAEKHKEGRLRTDDMIPQVAGEDAEAAVEPVAVTSSVAVLTDATFEDEVQVPGVAVFVKFFTPWCGHCQKMAPVWEELGEKYSSHAGVKIAKVDCTDQRELCSKHDVGGYPTLVIFKDGKQVNEFNGARSLDALAAFVEDNLSEVLTPEDPKDPKDEL